MAAQDSWTVPWSTHTCRHSLELALFRPYSASIDAPLGLPNGMFCLEEICSCQSEHLRMGREAERELARRGIPLYFTTKRSIIKEMVYRAMRLASALRTGGLQVLEVDPYASKVCLFGRQIPSNMKREDPVFSQQRLTDLIDGVARRVDEPDHDLCDALIAAQTAYLHTPR